MRELYYTLQDGWNVVNALDLEDRGKPAEAVNGPWRREGRVEAIRALSPTLYPTVFPTKAPCEKGAPLFFSLTDGNDEGYNLAMLRADGQVHELVRDQPGDFTLSGLDPMLMPIQSQVFKLDDGGYRMYFWAHYHGQPRQVRFMVAESPDLFHWQMANHGLPVLYHHSDRLFTDGRDWLERGFPWHLRCNDATTMYRQTDGSWELFSASLIFVQDSKSRFYQPGEYPAYVRIIERWISEDGFHFSNPEIVLTPDEKDPVGTHCYYLAATRRETCSVGFYGRYMATEQRATMEPIWSRDRRHWQRPTRQSILAEDGSSSYAIADLIPEDNERLRLYYLTCNKKHDDLHETMDGKELFDYTATATIHARKFFGRRLVPESRLVTPPLRYCGRNPRLYVDGHTTITCQWQEVLGDSMKHVPVEIQDDETVELDCKTVLTPGQAGRLFIQGEGTVYDLIY